MSCSEKLKDIFQITKDGNKERVPNQFALDNKFAYLYATGSYWDHKALDIASYDLIKELKKSYDLS